MPSSLLCPEARHKRHFAAPASLESWSRVADRLGMSELNRVPNLPSAVLAAAPEMTSKAVYAGILAGRLERSHYAAARPDSTGRPLFPNRRVGRRTRLRRRSGRPVPPPALTPQPAPVRQPEVARGPLAVREAVAQRMPSHRSACSISPALSSFCPCPNRAS